MPANDIEARALLARLLAPLRDESRAALRARIAQPLCEVKKGPSGAEYRLEAFVSQLPRGGGLLVTGIATVSPSRRWLPRQVRLDFSVLPGGGFDGLPDLDELAELLEA